MTTSTSFFPNTPSKEQIQQDVVLTMHLLLNQARFCFLRDGTSDEVLWSLVSQKPLDHSASFADPDLSPAELGLTFDDVANVEFVKTMMQLYDYGVLAIEDTSLPTLDNSEGHAHWTTCILEDLARSTFLKEWTDYAGDSCEQAVDHCLSIVEIASARLVLEGAQEGFFHKDRDAEGLTFRQLALLSSMSEASLRTLTSRGNGLVTVKGQRNSTYITIEHAKDWLKAKGRYTAIRRVSDLGMAPLTSQRFFSVEELQAAIMERTDYLRLEVGSDAMTQRLAASGVKWVVEQLPNGETLDRINEQQLLDRKVMKRLGAALELPAEMFALRAAETVLSEKLRLVEQELKGAKK